MDPAGSADRPGLDPPRVEPPRRRKRKKTPGSPRPASSAAKAKATSEEAAVAEVLQPPLALARLPLEVPTLGMDVEEVPPQEESEDEPQVTGVRTVGPTVWTVPCGVPLTVRGKRWRPGRWSRLQCRPHRHFSRGWREG